MASTPAILGGGIDISVAPLFTFASVVIEVMLLGHGVTSAFIVIPVAVAVGAVIGPDQRGAGELRPVPGGGRHPCA